MGNAAAIFAGIGGAAKGLAEGYSWQKEYEQKDRAITSREEIARLQAEIRQMIADAVENGRNQRWATPSGNALTGAESRETVAGINQDAANYRHDNASGDTLVREAGSDRRLTRNLDFGMQLENGRNSRWATPSGNARLGAQTQRYGIDTRSADSRYGVDVGADTTRRGQDVRSGDSRYATDKRNAMFQGIFGPVPVTPSAPPAGGGEEPPAAPAGATPVDAPRPVVGGQTPAAARTVGRPPITPPASNPPPQPQSAGAAVDREQQRRTRFEQIKAQIEARKKKGQDISDLIKELKKLRSGGAQ